MDTFIAKYAIPLLLILGFATRFIGISYPPNVVWDEQHFCNFTKGYLEGKYFFDIHPPLGKLFLLGALKAGHATTKNLDCAIGNDYPKDYPYVASRIPPAIAGSLLPAVVYLFASALELAPATSFFAASFVLADNAILAESHFGLIDIFVPFFAFLGLYFFLRHRKENTYSRAWWLWLLGASLCAALAIGTKWTGGGTLLVIGIVTLMESFEKKSLRLFLARLLPVGTIIVVVYIALFALHFRLLSNSGPGDAFMSPEFRASLRGTTEQQEGALKGPVFIAKFLELNKRMFEVNASQKLTHQDSSRFYEWPIGRKRIYFWISKLDGMRRIYLLANPVVWLFGSITTLGSIMYLVFRRKALAALAAKQEQWKARIRSLELLFLVYIVNWLPFAAITRAMFLYHYFSSLVTSILIGSFLVFQLVPALENENGESAKKNNYVYWIMLALAAAAFILYSPLSYGYHPFFR